MATYKGAGVDIAAAENLLRSVKPKITGTFTDSVVNDIGGFGGLFQLDVRAWQNPVLVSSIDGVGTKVKVALRAKRHDSIGADLVNHCVNDIAVCGAEPLFFLDYFATGALDASVASEVISGLACACKRAGIVLIGGETAEMPDVYHNGDYDLAGTIVGIVERGAIIDGSRVQPGDVLVGIPSSGLHTNGFSLARRVLLGTLGFPVGARPESLNGQTIEDALLAVHKCYLGLIRDLRGVARAFVHVTGGGIESNTVRVLPEGLNPVVYYTAWERPAVFRLIQERGIVPEEDMRHTFNLGIGLIVVVSPSDADEVIRVAGTHAETAVVIGAVR